MKTFIALLLFVSAAVAAPAAPAHKLPIYENTVTTNTSAGIHTNRAGLLFNNGTGGLVWATVTTTNLYNSDQFAETNGIVNFKTGAAVTNLDIHVLFLLDSVQYSDDGTNFLRNGVPIGGNDIVTSNLFVSYLYAFNILFSNSVTFLTTNVNLTNFYFNGTIVTNLNQSFSGSVNPTIDFLPYNLDGTNFADSPLLRYSSTAIGINDTNHLIESAGVSIRLKGNSANWPLILQNTNGENAFFGVGAGGTATIRSDIGETVLLDINTLTKNLIPAVSNAYTLGDPDHPYADVYVSTGSVHFIGPGLDSKLRADATILYLNDVPVGGGGGDSLWRSNANTISTFFNVNWNLTNSTSHSSIGPTGYRIQDAAAANVTDFELYQYDNVPVISAKGYGLSQFLLDPQNDEGLNIARYVWSSMDDLSSTIHTVWRDKTNNVIATLFGSGLFSNAVGYAFPDATIQYTAATPNPWTDDGTTYLDVGNTNAFRITDLDGSFTAATNNFAVNSAGSLTLRTQFPADATPTERDSPVLALEGRGWSPINSPGFQDVVVDALQQVTVFDQPAWQPGAQWNLGFVSHSTFSGGLSYKSYIGSGTMDIFSVNADISLSGQTNLLGMSANQLTLDGVPVGGSGSQTPWLSNIDGALFQLTNTSGVAIQHATNAVASGAVVTDVGLSVAFADNATNSVALANRAGITVSWLYGSDSSGSIAQGGAISAGSFEESSGGSSVESYDGSAAFGQMDLSGGSSSVAGSGSISTMNGIQSASSSSVASGGSFAALDAYQSANADAGAFNGSIVVGIAGSGERMWATNGSATFGRDVASYTDNTFSFGQHYTNSIGGSLALGSNGFTLFRVDGGDGSLIANGNALASSFSIFSSAALATMFESPSYGTFKSVVLTTDPSAGNSAHSANSLNSTNTAWNGIAAISSNVNSDDPNSQNGAALNLSGANDITSGSVQLGYDTSQGGVLAITDSSGLFQYLAGNLQMPGTLTTSDPGSGSGAWSLGKVVTGAVTSSVTNYVEVKIDGSIVKLVKAN